MRKIETATFLAGKKTVGMSCFKLSAICLHRRRRCRYKESREE